MRSSHFLLILVRPRRPQLKRPSLLAFTYICTTTDRRQPRQIPPSTFFYGARKIIQQVISRGDFLAPREKGEGGKRGEEEEEDDDGFG